MKTLACIGLALSAMVLVSGGASAQDRTEGLMLAGLREHRSEAQTRLLHDRSMAAVSHARYYRRRVQVDQAEIAEFDKTIRLYAYKAAHQTRRN
jgi:hypothetical protein